MPAILCFSRSELSDAHRCELHRIAGKDATVVVVPSNQVELVESVLEEDWDAIWARGLAEELRPLVAKHPAPKLVACSRELRSGRHRRQGGINDTFDHFELVDNDGHTKTLCNGELA